MTVRINKQKINLREKLAGAEDKVNFDEVVRGLGEYTGNVGIGTTNPDYKLHIASASPYIEIKDTNSIDENAITAIRFANETQGVSALHAYIGRAGSQDFRIFNTGDITFATGGVSSTDVKMRINAAGNVGIGTANPGDKKLYVDGPIQSTSSINYKDMEIVLPGGLGVSRTLFVVEPDSHYMVTVTRGDTPSQLTTCMVTTASSIDGDAADVNIHEITNSGHYSIIYETSNKSIRWKNDTSSSPPKINASVLKLK